MKNLVTTMTVIFILLEYTFAQAPDTLWTKTFGGVWDEFGQSIQQTLDGGYIVTGSSESPQQNALLIRTDENGNVMWTKHFGGIFNDSGLSVKQTLDGGYIITGYTYSYGAGEGDVWLIKTDENGDTLWTKTIGGIYNDKGHSIQQTLEGGYIITGFTYSYGAGGSDVWLIKTDEYGNLMWDKTFGLSSLDRGHSVQQTQEGGYIITGYTYLYGAGSQEYWLIKTDENGDSLWSKTFGGNTVDISYSVKQTFDGGYIITGYTYSYGAGRTDVWLIKTDEDGNLMWDKTFGGINFDRGHSVQQTLDGGYIITGTTASFGSGGYDVWVIRTDENGTETWNKTIGGNNDEWGNSIQQTLDGGYIIVGWTGFYTLGPYDIYLIKLESDVVEVDDNSKISPNEFNLSQNYPNPFNPSTSINFSIAEASTVKLAVYNLLGQEVKLLLNEFKEAGPHTITFDASSLPSGAYFYSLETPQFKHTKKMLLAK
jgi:hypothetical protein